MAVQNFEQPEAREAPFRRITQWTYRGLLYSRIHHQGRWRRCELKTDGCRKLIDRCCPLAGPGQ